MVVERSPSEEMSGVTTRRMAAKGQNKNKNDKDEENHLLDVAAGGIEPQIAEKARQSVEFRTQSNGSENEADDFSPSLTVTDRQTQGRNFNYFNIPPTVDLGQNA